MVVVPQDPPARAVPSAPVARPQLAAPTAAAPLPARHPQGGGRPVLGLRVERVGVGLDVGLALGEIAAAVGGGC